VAVRAHRLIDPAVQEADFRVPTPSLRSGLRSINRMAEIAPAPVVAAAPEGIDLAVTPGPVAAIARVAGTDLAAIIAPVAVTTDLLTFLTTTGRVALARAVAASNGSQAVTIGRIVPAREVAASNGSRAVTIGRVAPVRAVVASNGSPVATIVPFVPVRVAAASSGVRAGPTAGQAGRIAVTPSSTTGSSTKTSTSTITSTTAPVARKVGATNGRTIGTTGPINARIA